MNTIQGLKVNIFSRINSDYVGKSFTSRRLGMSSMKNYIYNIGNPNPLFKIPL